MPPVRCTDGRVRAGARSQLNRGSVPASARRAGCGSRHDQVMWASALKAAHAVGVVHRDLKPDNILLGRDGRIAITDFGIALLDDGSATAATGIVGTPAYMSPEQVEAKSLDGRTDLYSLGLVLYEMLTGRRAFHGGSPVALPDRFYTGSANLSLRYRVSSWGAEYRTLQANRLEAMARRGDSDGVALALLGQVAESYYDAVSAAQQVEVLERQLDVSRQLADLTQLRFERGEATALDVLQQRQQEATTRANLPPIRADYRTAVARLEALVGSEPGTGSFSVPQMLPDLPADVTYPSGTPGPVVGLGQAPDRPDLRGADARLEATESQAASARWRFLPTVDFSANVGSQFFRSIDTRSQSNWGAALTVSVPVLDGLDRVGQVREAGASRRATGRTSPMRRGSSRNPSSRPAASTSRSPPRATGRRAKPSN